MIFGGFIGISVIFEALYGPLARGHFLDREYGSAPKRLKKDS